MAKKKPPATPAEPVMEPGHFLGSITFKKEYRCFKKGEVVPFKAGVTLLVGDQGCGKSTVIQSIRGYDKHKDVIDVLVLKGAPSMSLDLETELPRGKSRFSDDVGMKFQLALLFASHGEAVRAAVRGIDNPQFKSHFFLFDEPDMALSPRSCYDLARQLKGAAALGSQVIVSIHSPIVMQEIGEVYSLEHRRLMTAEEFLETQKRPRLDKEEEAEEVEGKSTKVEKPYIGPGRDRPRRPARRDIPQ